MAYKNCRRYTDEFWGAKIKSTECNLDLEPDDVRNIIEKTKEMMVELYDPKRMKNVPIKVFVRYSEDDGDYEEYEFDLTEYIKETLDEIIEEKDELFEDEEEFYQ